MYRFLWENRSSFLCDALLCSVTLLHLTLCDATHCSPPGSSVSGNSPGKNIGVGCHALLQGIFTIQGSNPGLSHCRQILYGLSHRGSPRILEWVTHPFSMGFSWPRNRTRVSFIAGRWFTSWATSKAQLKCRQVLKEDNRAKSAITHWPKNQVLWTFVQSWYRYLKVQTKYEQV